MMKTVTTKSQGRRPAPASPAFTQVVARPRWKVIVAAVSTVRLGPPLVTD